MELIIATDEDQYTWDEIVKSSPQGTLFHTWKWLKIIEKHNFLKIFSRSYNGQLYPCILKMGNEIVGLMPVFIYKTPFIKIACSPPFSVETAYLGPVLNNYSSLKSNRRQVIFSEFNQAVDDYLKKELKVNYISIHSSPGLSDPRPYFWSNYQVFPYFTNILDIRDGEKNVWDGFNQNVRKSINKLEKLGITGELGDKNNLMEVYDLLKNLDRIHASKQFLEEIFNNFSPENVNLFIAKKDDTLLTGVLAINFNNKVSIWVGNPKSEYKGISPNYTVIWNAIQWACNKKFTDLEIIDASDISYFPFKRQFNGEIVPYYIMKWYSPLWKFGNTLKHLVNR
jgi:hypothetical protein